MNTKTVLLVVAFGALSAASYGANAQSKFINIGTASIGGSYYPAGGQVCDLVNKGREKNGYKFRCSVEATGGSTANARAMRAGDLQVALLESDTAFKAWNGIGEFKDDGPNHDLRFIMSLHPDIFQIVTRANKPVHTITDLKGQTVNTSSPGTGTQSAIYLALGDAYHTTSKELFKRESMLTAGEQGSALCDGKIDAFIYETGISAPSIIEPVTVCNATVSGWWDDTIAKMIEDRPYLIAATIPKGTYANQTEDLKTWGDVTILAVSAKVPDDVAYYIAKAVFDNFDQFKGSLPAFRTLTPKGSATSGQVIPYASGALRFYREVKLVNP